MATIEVKVPSIGDYKDVPVIDVLVKPGDAVKADDGLVTLESDKATMDVPAPAAGTVRELRVKVGDRVSEGSVVLTLDSAEAKGGKVDGKQDRADGAQAKAPPPSERRESRGGASAGKEPQAQPAAASQPPPATGGGGKGRGQGPQASAPSTVEVKVPAIGDFKDVPVIEVLVKAGDEVAPDQGLVTLESEKATMDVPSPAAGKVKEVRLKVGDRVGEGAVVLVLETAADAEGQQREEAAPPPSAAKAPQPQADAGVQTPSPAPSGGGMGRGQAAPQAAAPAEAQPQPSARVHASPSVRKLARELGVELGRVTGTGPRGRILHGDVQGFVKEVMTGAAQARPGAGGGVGLDLPAWPKVDFARFGPVEQRPLTRIQKISGPALSRNWVMIPHVTQFDEADITDLETFRVRLNEENAKSGAKVTLLAFLVKACVAALRRFPEVNASLEGDHLVLKRYFHIGFAADTPNGLVVPVVKNADQKGLLDVARELGELAAKARDGKLQSADIQGGTFSISSLGGIGGTMFTPIINAPEVAILGVSRSVHKPVWDGKAFQPRLVLPLSLSYDHRVVDGALAARFTTFL
ncbi:MAG TPA: dihydrolipoyllysine-residue acetyltransferase, partial [Myxococcales bacterium]